MPRSGAFWGASRWLLWLSGVGVAPGQAFFDQPNIVCRHTRNSKSGIVEDREMLGSPLLKRSQSE